MTMKTTMAMTMSLMENKEMFKTYEDFLADAPSHIRLQRYKDGDLPATWAYLYDRDGYLMDDLLENDDDPDDDDRWR